MELIPKRKLQLRWLCVFFIVHSSKDVEFRKKWFFSPRRNNKMLVLECELFLKCKWHDFTAAFIKTAKSSHQLVWCDFFDAISTIFAHFNQRPYVCYEYDTMKKKIYRNFSFFSKFFFSHYYLFGQDSSFTEPTQGLSIFLWYFAQYEQTYIGMVNWRRNVLPNSEKITIWSVSKKKKAKQEKKKITKKKVEKRQHRFATTLLLFIQRS